MAKTTYFARYLERKKAELGFPRQQDLADAIGEDRINVNRWLGDVIPKPERVEEIVKILGPPLIGEPEDCESVESILRERLAEANEKIEALKKKNKDLLSIITVIQKEIAIYDENEAAS